MNVTIIYYQELLIKIRNKSINLYTRLFSCMLVVFFENDRKIV